MRTENRTWKELAAFAACGRPLLGSRVCLVAVPVTVASSKPCFVGGVLKKWGGEGKKGPAWTTKSSNQSGTVWHDVRQASGWPFACSLVYLKLFRIVIHELQISQRWMAWQQPKQQGRKRLRLTLGDAGATEEARNQDALKQNILLCPQQTGSTATDKRA